MQAGLGVALGGLLQLGEIIGALLEEFGDLLRGQAHLHIGAIERIGIALARWTAPVGLIGGEQRPANGRQRADDFLDV